MKKKALFCLSLFIFHSNIFAQSIIYRPEFSVHYAWNTSDSNWEYIDSCYFEYNSQGFETSNLTSINGVFYEKKTTTYDASNQIIEVLTQEFNNTNSVFVNSSRTTFIYFSDGDLQESKYETWNSLQNNWMQESGTLNIKTVDVNNVETLITQYYNPALLSYEDFRKTIMVPNANNIIISIEYLDFEGSNWINKKKCFLNYGANGELEDFEIHFWSDVLGEYRKLERYSEITWGDWANADVTKFYYYSSMNNILDIKLVPSEFVTRTLQVWNGNTWDTVSRESNTFDFLGGRVILRENYSLGQWVNSKRYSIFKDLNYNNAGGKEENWFNSLWVINWEQERLNSYNSNQNIIQIIDKYWNNSTQTLINENRTDFGNFGSYLKTPTILKDYNSSKVIISPNPVSKTEDVKIKTQGLSENARFVLFNVAGKQVLKLNATENSSFECAKFEGGIYFYQVFHNSLVIATGKIVIQ